jgi:hypothetical protein
MPKRWDANWDRLKLETKINRLKDRIDWLQGKSEQDSRSAHSAASTALYVANLSR